MNPPYEQIKDAQFAAETSLFDVDLDESPRVARKDFRHLDFRCDENGDLEKLPARLESRGITSQAELWNRAVMHTQSVISKLKSISRFDLSSSVENCHSEESVKVCNGCRRVTVFFNRCERFYCPQCQPRLARERRESVEWWAREVGEPKHVILTVRNVNEFTKAYVQWFKQCFGKLRRRSFARNWRGGFYRLEVTNEKNGWHLHLHALVDAGWIDAKKLSVTWAEIVGQNLAIVKVKDVHGRDYLAEVTKYSVKGNEIAAWKPEDIAAFVDAFSGVKTFGVFGSLYGKRTEWREFLDQLQKGKAACSCGCEQFRILSANEHAWNTLQAECRQLTGPRPPPLDTPFFPDLGPIEGRPSQHWKFE